MTEKQGLCQKTLLNSRKSKFFRKTGFFPSKKRFFPEKTGFSQEKTGFSQEKTGFSTEKPVFSGASLKIKVPFKVPFNFLHVL